MGKASRRKRLRREQALAEEGAVLVEHQHPLSGLPRAEIDKILREAGAGHERDFDQSSLRLPELVGQVDPLVLMSVVVNYFLTVTIFNDGTIEKPPDDDFHQAYAELIQALCLRTAPERVTGRPPTPAEVTEITDGVRKWANQFAWKRLANLDTGADPLQRARVQVQEHIRGATQVVRNWGYLDQVTRMCLALLEPLDERFVSTLGFSGTGLIHAFVWVLEEADRRRNAHLSRLAELGAAKSVRDLVEKYFAVFQGLEGTPAELVAHLEDRRASLQEARSMLVAHSDLRLPACFTFSVEDVAAGSGLAPEDVERMLALLSLRFGSTAAAPIEHLFLGNPVWTKPLIRLEEGTYFCPLPQLFFSFFFETVADVLRGNDAVKRAYDKRRSDYLERSAAELLRRAFPGANVIPNFKWTSEDGSQQFESDTVVQVDSFLLLVEQKSGHVSPSARRGSPDRLADDIDRLLVAPSRQSARLEEMILKSQRKEPGTEAFARAFPLPLDAIHRTIRLSVTLEDVGFLQTHLNGLKEARYVPSDMAAAPAMTLADMEVVFDILQSPPHRLHYLIRRTELEGRLDYVGDEIDMLGLYLENGLNLGDIEFRGQPFFLAGMSKAVDEYHEAVRYGLERPRPEHKLRPWWRDVLKRLAERRPPRWTEAAVILLCAAFKEQKKLEKHRDALIRYVRTRREKAMDRNIMVFSPAKGRGDAIAIAILTREQLPQRARLIQNAASHALARDGVRQCVVLMLNADEPSYPYNSISAFFAGEADPKPPSPSHN